LAVDFKPDCEKCSALCCTAMHFGTADGKFPFEKPEGVPCPNLARDFRCKIYPDLAATGYLGCVEFDCYGAGQKVTQETFDGCNWRDNPEMSQRIFDGFQIVKSLHELLVYLTELQGLCRDAALAARIQDRMDEIERLSERRGDDILTVDVMAEKAEVETLIAQVRATR
jgi:hypothetical protein